VNKSEQMARVRGKDTQPELLVRGLLSDEDVRYRLHLKSIPGCPDVYIPRLHLAVFVNGCFWHGHDCRRGVRPKTNRGFWKKKIEDNLKRDAAVRTKLAEIGVDALTLWTCEAHRFSTVCRRIASRYHRRIR
jgi:DNA mismatch endonuclease, patch repair protein